MVKHTQTICRHCLSVFDHFVGLALEGLSQKYLKKQAFGENLAREFSCFSQTYWLKKTPTGIIDPCDWPNIWKVFLNQRIRFLVILGKWPVHILCTYLPFSSCAFPVLNVRKRILAHIRSIVIFGAIFRITVFVDVLKINIRKRNSIRKVDFKNVQMKRRCWKQFEISKTLKRYQSLLIRYLVNLMFYWILNYEYFREPKSLQIRPREGLGF